jgi:hypothetical protein
MRFDGPTGPKFVPVIVTMSLPFVRKPGESCASALKPVMDGLQ